MATVSSPALGVAWLVEVSNLRMKLARPGGLG